MVNRPIRRNALRYFPPNRPPCVKDCTCYACRMSGRCKLRIVGIELQPKKTGKSRLINNKQLVAAFYRP